MTVKECYLSLNGDYEGTLARLLKDERIAKYLRMFVSGPDYADLLAALPERRFEDAFRAVHNLKGVSLNLGLTPLATVSSTLCEALRHGEPTVDVSPMLDDVKSEYARVISVIAQLD